MHNSSLVINHSFTVSTSKKRAFEVFTEELSSWWPKEYTWAGEVLESIRIEPKKNGRCFERGPHGFTCDWGRVLIWEPPDKVVFSWQIAPDRVPEPNPEKASEVEVTFVQLDKNETHVKFEHRNFENHGKNAVLYQQALNSPEGWHYILNRYRKSVK